LGQVRLERSRRFGDCCVGLELWRKLGLDRLLERLLDGETADVAWSRVAAVLAINRLIAPASERGIEQTWYPTTALDDLVGIAPGQLNDTRLYRCLDRLVRHKAALETHLKQRYGELFEASFDVLLYDLTSTYVEGQGEENRMLRRGYSRDHRPDCKQLVLALVVNPEGFPCSYEVFDGNRADVTTLQTMLRVLERKYGRARRVWVFDRGIVSEANLKVLRRRGARYLVGTPREKLKEFEQELLAEDWAAVREDVEVKLVRVPSGEETYVLCRTRARQEKETAIRSRFSNRLETALESLARRIETGRLKDRLKMERQLGGILARHPQVADLYEAEIQSTPQGVRLVWIYRQERRDWQELREGAYLLRTNLEAETAEQLWTKYIQLTEVESVFRTLKSELAIRPIFHRKESRIKAHVLVAFLGYALWVTLKHLLKARGSDLSPARALSLLSTIQSADIVLPTTDGREIRLRRVTRPEPQQKELLNQLKITLPERLDFNPNVVQTLQSA
jgi:transposase